jgi:hypothetical protein
MTRALRCPTTLSLALLLALGPRLAGQAVPDSGTSLVGRVTDLSSGSPLSGATVSVEGTVLRVTTDPSGRFRITQPPAGPQVLRVIRLGYAPFRQSVLLPGRGSLTLDVAMARQALNLPNLSVTADAVSRARGELGTASVIDQEAIRNQTATSLYGVLELIPGVVLQPPGLDGVQQFGLRASAVSPGGASPGGAAGQPSAQALASFGTQIVLDGVPVSNNANLQSLGPRGELSINSSAGGGIDLRRLPATTIERVEVIRGIPSARFGDLTQGAILVDTRAGHFKPEVLVRLDPRTLEASIVGGRGFSKDQTGSATLNLARTRIAPGQTQDMGTRVSAQVAHRYEGGRLRLDTRVDGFQLLDDRPENPIFPGVASQSRDNGLRVSERARVSLGGATWLEWTAAGEFGRQRSFTQSSLLRGAAPFTNRLTEGRQVGKFVGGSYLARVDVQGNPRHLYSRMELVAEPRWFGMGQILRTGIELRREWNSGPGYRFDIEFPPQVLFNGVNGYDRPRTFDAVPPLATSALYIDDRFTTQLGGAGFLYGQFGLRAELLHEEGNWFSGTRDAVLQPRANLEFAPFPSLRVRAGAGRLAKAPSLATLYPGLQYYDLVNVNYYANDPAERLAVVTTRIVDKTNPDLGYSVADRLEGGFELNLPSGAQISLVGYHDRITGGVGFRPELTFFLREQFRIVDSTIGTGRPPEFEEPAFAADTVPVLIDRPANNLDLRTSGVELVATLPEFARTRLALLGSWARSRLRNHDIEFGSAFSTFQLDERVPRTPYWDGGIRTGELALLTTRIIHHQPRAGLVITGTIQLHLRERRQTEAGVDTLSFAGYLTRDGRLVPVPRERRGDAEFHDLRLPRSGVLTVEQKGPADWLFSLQVSKSLPLDGRLSFYAFNAFDRVGNYGDRFTTARLFSSTRFGLEVLMPVGVWQ